eukprot:CAMPEP_0171651996 /NCGR_PEP_ID=MMETSP0990-20121206/38683_1 /TAXON_ID=483369 /ORGANISM="non described non described, Strain CCMP2098" /LENGTH=70 /DNA_ID=CAMNT_0012231115 /DNA_START=248 /DNA_END=458 /DNA_ORIENTATION=+
MAGMIAAATNKAKRAGWLQRKGEGALRPRTTAAAGFVAGSLSLKGAADGLVVGGLAVVALVAGGGGGEGR